MKKLMVIPLIAILATTLLVRAPTMTIHLPTILDSSLGYGSQFTMDVTLTDAFNVFGWQLNITFNKNVLNVVSITLGSTWAAMPNSVVQSINNPGGTMMYSFSKAQYPPTGFSGVGPTVMITIRWTVMTGFGWTAIHFVTTTENPQLGTMFVDTSTQQLTYDTEDGLFSNSFLGPQP